MNDRLCIHCKFCVFRSILFIRLPGFERCKRIVSQVDGTPALFCSIERDPAYDKNSDVCTSKGKYFEPRQSKERTMFLLKKT